MSPAVMPATTPAAKLHSPARSLYRTILVAYDGGSASDVALRQAADLARHCQVVLHVLAIVVTAGGLLLDPTTVPNGLMTIERGVLVAAMDAAVGTLGDQGGDAVTTIRDGDAVIEITAYAHEIKADLLVLGHSDKGPLASWLQGSMGRHMLHHPPCSVLIAIGAA